MFIESIELKNYRNYGELHMDFDPGTNVLYGDNAQGKTNILEAVYVCATTKSHRGSKDREIIEFGEDESHIKMQLRKDDVPYRIDMHLKKNKTKGVAVNGIPIRRASELFGIVNVVFFSPEDLNLIDPASPRTRDGKTAPLRAYFSVSPPGCTAPANGRRAGLTGIIPDQ